MTADIRQTESITQTLKSLPSLPGVYQMLNDKGETIYVGKAANLKKRVSSYFQKTSHDAKTVALVRQIERIETIVTHTESEALLLENNLIILGDFKCGMEKFLKPGNVSNKMIGGENSSYSKWIAML